MTAVTPVFKQNEGVRSVSKKWVVTVTLRISLVRSVNLPMTFANILNIRYHAMNISLSYFFISFITPIIVKPIINNEFLISNPLIEMTCFKHCTMRFSHLGCGS